MQADVGGDVVLEARAVGEFQLVTENWRVLVLRECGGGRRKGRERRGERQWEAKRSEGERNI